MKISTETKIGSIIKHNPAALDAIISLSNRFEKLRNPVLRKLMANRTSVGQAAKIGGCSTKDFFNILAPIGFEVEEIPEANAKKENPAMPGFLAGLSEEQLVLLDVRPYLNEGQDPLQVIMKTVSSVKPGQTLKIVAGFEPTPLMGLLGNKRWQSYCHWVDSNTAETFFYKSDSTPVEEVKPAEPSTTDWKEILEKYLGKVKYIDVRPLEMPLPMQTILKELKQLPEDQLLYVYHKRFPVYLVDELKAGGFDFRIKEVGPGEVHLIIYKEL